jgi:murein DD-endopeptidase MepM/ murein hydrolase activator NlpD
MAIALVLLLSHLLAPAPPPTVEVAVTARAFQPGELVVIGITTSAPVPVVQARAFGRSLVAHRLDEHTWRALAGIDLDIAPGTYDVTVEAGPTRATRPIVVVAKSFPTRRLTVNPNFVNPPATVLARIEAEAKRVAALWRDSSAAPLWEGAFTAPVAERANSAFGTRSIYNGEPRSPHGGADFPSPAGTPVRAPNGGRVVLADDLYYTGLTVAVDHGLGLVSLFAHLSALDVAEGATVQRGQTVGRVGATGRVTGAHLHWTVRAGGARIDPLSLLAVLGPNPPETR